MGSSFASNLLSRGYNIHVYNRTKEKAQLLVEKGATFHPTPKALASASDIIMTSLTDEGAVDAVTYGEEGLLNGAKKGALWIDLSTIDPSASIRHSEAAKQAGLERLDTPVVGSKDQINSLFGEKFAIGIYLFNVCDILRNRSTSFKRRAYCSGRRKPGNL